MQSRINFGLRSRLLPSWAALAGGLLVLTACGGGGSAGPTKDSGTGDGSSDTGLVSGDTGTGGGDTGEGDTNPSGGDTGSADTGEGDTGAADSGFDTNVPPGDSGTDTNTGDTSPATFTVGGTLSGLNGTIVLQDNSADNLTLTSSGAFTFATPLGNGSPFDVTVLTQPTGQLCAVMGPTGTISGANVTTVTVICANVGPTDAGDAGDTSTTTDGSAGGPFGIGGTITGLPAGASVTLADNGADVTISSNGTYAFPAAVPSGTAYAVTVATQPVGATCTVANGTGTVTANVTNIAVTCAGSPVTIGGNLTGLMSGTVVLQDNGGNSLSLSAVGAFTFTSSLTSGTAYAVTILTQPVGQTCTVTNGTGTATANVTNVAVACGPQTYTIGGTVSGLTAANSIVLTDNGNDNVTVGSNGTFVFANQVATGGMYAVTIKTQPTGQTCTLAGATGTVAGANIASVVVNCNPLTFTVGGTISGLSPGDSVSLQDNATDTSFFATNGTFAMNTPLATGKTYAITINGNPQIPVAQTCVVMNGTGTVGSANVTTVTITCTTNSYTIAGTVTGLAATDALVLQDNGADNFTFPVGTGSPAGGAKFTFATAIKSGLTYNVTAINPTAPVAMTCTASPVGTNGATSPANGSVGSANVTGININCIANPIAINVQVNGLSANDNITVTSTLPAGGSQNFTSAAPGPLSLGTVLSGSAYNVVSPLNPVANAGQTLVSQNCTIAGGQGTAGAVAVTLIVTCVTNSVALTLDVNGLDTSMVGGNSVTVLNSDTGVCNGVTCKETGNGSFPLGNVLSGTAFNFGVSAQPTNPVQTCTLTSSTSATTGIVSAAPITITANCVTNQWTISGQTNNLLGALTLNDNGACLGAGCANDTFTGTGGTNVAFTGWTVAGGSNYNITFVPPLPANCGGGTNGNADVCWNGAGQANQDCTMVQTAGGPVNANVTAANGPQVTCTTNSFTFSGTVLGLATGNTITVQDGSAANQVVINGTGAASANFTLPTAIPSGSGPFPGGGYALTFAGTSTGGTIQNVGPTATYPAANFNVNGAVPQLCTITPPTAGGNALYIQNANVTAANGPVITCQNIYTVGGTVSWAAPAPSGATAVVLSDSSGGTFTASATNGVPYYIQTGYLGGLPTGFVKTAQAYNITMPAVNCANGDSNGVAESGNCGVAGSQQPSTCKLTTAGSNVGTVTTGNITNVNWSCTVNTSCAKIFSFLGSSATTTPSGAYQLDPTNGTAAANIYADYCDNTDQGGGWTLVAKMNGNNTTWQYSSNMWTSNAAAQNLATTSTDLSQTEARFQSWNEIPVNNILATMQIIGGNGLGNELVVGNGEAGLTFGTPYASMVTLFNAPSNTVFFGGVGAWPGNVSSMRNDWVNLTSPVATPQLQCNLGGINVGVTSGVGSEAAGANMGNWAEVRLGLLTNQDAINDCTSPDSEVGFGTFTGSSACRVAGPFTGGPSVGASDATCTGGNNYVADFGYLFVQ